MRAAYDSIYFDIKNLVESGEYRYRDFLPSESTLVKKYGCAHNTVRKALSILAREGYVQPIHGKGVRVIHRSSPVLARQETRMDMQGIESFRQMGSRLGVEVSTKVLMMESFTAGDEFAQYTGFYPDDEIVHLERIRYFNQRPLEWETNYFRADMVQGMKAKDAERSIYHYIENVRGKKLASNKRIFSIERVDERDSELIQIGDATHVMEVRLVTYDREGLVCEVTKARFQPESFSFRNAAQQTRVSDRNR